MKETLKALLDKVKYLALHLTGKKAIVVIATLFFLWYNHPEGQPFTDIEITAAVALPSILMATWGYEKANS